MRVYVIPAGTKTDENRKAKPIIFLNCKDEYMPDWGDGQQYAGKLLMLGGAVEEGDQNHTQALIREMREEVPGWYEEAHLPGTSKRVFGHSAEKGFALLHEDARMAIYACAVDGNVVSWQRLKRSCQEGSMVSVGREQLLRTPLDQFLGGAPMRKACLKLLPVVPEYYDAFTLITAASRCLTKLDLVVPCVENKEALYHLLVAMGQITTPQREPYEEDIEELAELRVERLLSLAICQLTKADAQMGATRVVRNVLLALNSINQRN
jgi:hypothetical protein